MVPQASEPIIDRTLWDDVQAILATNGNTDPRPGAIPAQGRLGVGRAGAHALVHAQEERAVVPLLPAGPRQNRACGASGLPRLPATELKGAVLEQVRGILRAPGMVNDVVARAVELDPILDEAQVTVAMIRLDAIWDQLFPIEQQRIVRLLVEKVIVSPSDIEIRLGANGIKELALELRPAVPEEEAAWNALISFSMRTREESFSFQADGVLERPSSG
ncbi:MAG: hypothetical protein M3461_04935 [Pseudomonadota bacterium]|nr:hypothetical protein [Pseudomonadota bacterium]